MAFINGNEVLYGVVNLKDGEVTDAYTKAETNALLDKKENSLNKVNSFGGQSQTGDDVKFPTVKATRDYVDAKIGDFEDDYDGQLDDIDAAKVDKTTTIAGLPLSGNITVAQLKQALGIEVDSGLSQTSTNAVQNKIITTKLNEIIAEINAIKEQINP